MKRLKKKIAKKSLFTNKSLNKYEKIKISNLIPMRPYNNGIPVNDLDLILNKNKKTKKISPNKD